MTSISASEPDQQLRITLFRGDGDPDVWIELRGEADTFSTDELRARLFEALEQRGNCHRALIDLRDLTFTDFASTTTLVEFAEAAQRHGCDVRFFGPRRIFIRVLDILDMTQRVQLA
jgi:anti-anti-sigma factor